MVQSSWLLSIDLFKLTRAFLSSSPCVPICSALLYKSPYKKNFCLFSVDILIKTSESTQEREKNKLAKLLTFAQQHD